MSISRRSFLQGVGIGCSACALGAFPPGALARNPIAGINGKTTLTPSLCEMCSFRCPIQAQVVNNKTVFIQGNPSAPQQGTRICARGGSGVSLVNDPQRIVKPMKRTGPRGDGEWQVISWQQAYQEIAAKMKPSKRSMAPRAWLSLPNRARSPAIFSIWLRPLVRLIPLLTPQHALPGKPLRQK